MEDKERKMNSKLEEWFNIKGKRLVELKVKGGREFFITRALTYNRTIPRRAGGENNSSIISALVAVNCQLVQ